MLVGEQPGDAEDLAGHPFVGPAGSILDRALQEAGISRKEVFVSNAVKHFKFEPRGKRRLHVKPNVGEIEACRWWLAEELKFVRTENHRGARRFSGARPARTSRHGLRDARSANAFRRERSCLGDGASFVSAAHSVTTRSVAPNTADSFTTWKARWRGSNAGASELALNSSAVNLPTIQSQQR